MDKRNNFNWSFKKFLSCHDILNLILQCWFDLNYGNCYLGERYVHRASWYINVKSICFCFFSGVKQKYTGINTEVSFVT